VHRTSEQYREIRKEYRQVSKTPAKTEAKQGRDQALLGVFAPWQRVVFFAILR
jgi:hypothetical protein